MLCFRFAFAFAFVFLSQNGKTGVNRGKWGVNRGKWGVNPGKWAAIHGKSGVNPGNGVKLLKIYRAQSQPKIMQINILQPPQGGWFRFGTTLAYMNGSLRTTEFKMSDSENNEKWFCNECTALLGIIQGEALIIRYKQEVNLTVTGNVLMVCRRCGTINQIETEKQPA